MPRELLKAAQVSRLLGVKGKHRDGGGLYLHVHKAGQASWCYQFRLGGRTLWGTIGPASLYPLAEARAKHTAFRRIIHEEGRDPRTAGPAAATGVTFKEALADYLADTAPEWKGGATGKQAISYKNSFDLIPAFLKLPVASIQPKDINEAIKAWADKPVTRNRMKTRIKAVLHLAVNGERRKRKAGPKAVHHPAMPFGRVPGFITELLAVDRVEARALAFTILTAARTAEVLGATWGEIRDVVDHAGETPQPTWIVPADRMKAERDHRIPLTPAMLMLIGPRGADDTMLFPGYAAGRRKDAAVGALRNSALRQTLNDLRPDDLDPESGRRVVVHGFRTSFRTWLGEKTNYDGALGEFALAHSVGSEVEKAYQRGDALEKRRALMTDWCAFCMNA